MTAQQQQAGWHWRNWPGLREQDGREYNARNNIVSLAVALRTAQDDVESGASCSPQEQSRRKTARHNAMIAVVEAVRAPYGYELYVIENRKDEGDDRTTETR